MTIEQTRLIEKAQKSLDAAQQLNATGYPEFAVSRAYYAMFYLASAFLEGKGLNFSKHSAVIAAFGQQFVKTGEIPSQYHRYLIDAEKTRCNADYSTLFAITEAETQLYIDNAKDFLDFSIKTLL